MESNDSIQKLKGIKFNKSVTDVEQAKISAIFSQPRSHNSLSILTNYTNGMTILNRLLKDNQAQVNSLFFYQNVGNNNRYNSEQLSKEISSDLHKELSAISERLNLNAKIKTEEGKLAARKSFKQTVAIFHYLTNVNSISDINLDMFKAFIKPLRTKEDRWHKDTNPHVHKALRGMALCLDHQFNCTDFIKCVEVQRSDTKNKAKDLFAKPSKHLKKWVESWLEFLDAKNAFTTKDFKDSATKMRDFLEEAYASDSNTPFPNEPLLYFSKYRNEEFYEWLNALCKDDKMSSKVVIKTISAMNSYGNWFIDTYMSDTDETGELVTLGYPLVSNHKISQITAEHGNEDSGEIKLSESSKPSPPLWMVLKLKEILTENDYAWPKSLTSQYNDSIVDKDGNPVWIPVITYLYLVMLEIPLRKIQVLRLDSGEGDAWKYDAKSDCWVKNDHQLANYWKKTGAKVHNRGVFRRKLINGILSPQFIFYINSNKTSDKNVGFGENSGYEIPWKNANVIKYLDELMTWQKKYNPAFAPVRYRDIPNSIFEGDPAKKVLDSIPDRFYLFRAAKDIKNGNRQMPPTIRMLHEFWVNLMDELEKRLHDEGVDCQIIISRNKKTNAPQQALYTPHGLRLAGLTSLAQQGVPIEILSKVVAGHQSILMTIYYQKFHPSHISEVLNEASRDLELKFQQSFQNWLKEAAWDQVAKYAAYNSEDAIDGVLSDAAKCTSSLWNSTNLGLCPYNGTRCKDGGACVRKNGKGNNIYLPVEEKNCVMCRHLITGLPWLTELWVHGNALLLKSEKISKELEECLQDSQALKVQRKNMIRDSKEIPQKLISKIKQAQTLHEKKSIELDIVFSELHATHNLIEKIKKLPKAPIYDENKSENENLPALLMHSDSEFELDYVESPNNFQSLDFVVQASRFYKHEKNEAFEREREVFMDTILLRNGYEPLMLMNLTEREKQQSADALAKFLVTKVDAETLQLLKEGRKQLSELGIEQEMMEALPVDIPKNLMPQPVILPS
ncbi:VPA1269 family protein [Vibrio sp. WXL103]|uniref:VPA1269 family protein n=1 Tax=Vibrio sp. WXL103 TaxID=3450710 RepID=UPI003EC79FF5